MVLLARLAPPLALLASALGGDLVVPRLFETKEAPLGNRFPFGPENWETIVRYQQAYGASELAPLAGGSITHVAFRADRGPNLDVQGGGQYLQLELRLSTRAGLVDQLDQDLDANPGPNETLVYSGTFTLPDLEGNEAPNPFELVFELQTPFPYGGDDLLLDVRYASETVPRYYLDATADNFADQVSRAVEMPGKVLLDSVGLVTRFSVDGLDVGTSYCGPSVPNSSGLPAAITACGSVVVAQHFLSLRASQLPPGQFGYFIVGDTQGFSQPPGSQGNLCLAGQIGRYAQQVLKADANGDFALPIDLTALPVSPPHAVQAGETWNFQAWFRDKNPGATSNFTDGVSVLFQ